MKNTINNNEIPTILLRIFAFIAFAVLCSIALSLPSKAQTSNNVEKWTVTKTQVGDYEIVMKDGEPAYEYDWQETSIDHYDCYVDYNRDLIRFMNKAKSV